MLTPAPSQSSSLNSDNDPALRALESAKTKQDVQSLIERYGYENIAPLWKKISPAQRAALSLIRFFSGSTIIHEPYDTKGKPNPL